MTDLIGEFIPKGEAIPRRLECTATPGLLEEPAEVSGGHYARVGVTSSLANWAGTPQAGPGHPVAARGITFPAPTSDWGRVVGFTVFDAAMARRETAQEKLAKRLRDARVYGSAFVMLEDFRKDL